MRRLLLLIALFATVMLTLPVQAANSDMVSVVREAGNEEIHISVAKNAVHVMGAQGKILEVISLIGRHVMTVRIDSPAQKIELNLPKGCYIIKVGKVTRKVIL